MEDREEESEVEEKIKIECTKERNISRRENEENDSSFGEKRHCMLRCKKSETENDAYDHPQENETTTFSFHLSLHFSSSSLFSSFSESEFLLLSIKSFFLSETYLKISHSLFPFSNEYHST